MREELLNKIIYFIVIILLACGLWAKNEELERVKRQPSIIYQTDSAGAVRVGIVTNKEKFKGRFTVTVEGYGKFLVTEEQYEQIKIGDMAPREILERGS